MLVRRAISAVPFFAALMIVSFAVVPCVSWAASDDDGGGKSPQSAKSNSPSAKDTGKGDATRTVDELPVFCEPIPPCNRGCKKDTIRNTCVPGNDAPVK